MAKKGKLVGHWRSPEGKYEFGLRDDSEGRLHYSSAAHGLTRRKGPQTLALVKKTKGIEGWKRAKPKAEYTDPEHLRTLLLNKGFVEVVWDARATAAREVK